MEDHSQSSYNANGLAASSRKEKGSHDRIGRQEDKTVTYLKVLVLLVLVVSAIGVSVAVYKYMANKEASEFEHQFDSDAHKVLESLGNGLDGMLGATDATGVKIVSHVRRTPGMEWPFVTIPDFTIQALKMLRLSSSIFVGFDVVVTEEQREQYQQYVSQPENQEWIENSLDLLETYDGYYGPIERQYNTTYDIYGFQGPVPGPAPGKDHYVVIRHAAPMVPSAVQGYPYNFDLRAYPVFVTALDHAFDTRKATLAAEFMGIITDPDDPMQVASAQAAWQWGNYYAHPDTNVKEPSSQIFYPILDTIDSVVVDTAKQHKASYLLPFHPVFSPSFILTPILFSPFLSSLRSSASLALLSTGETSSRIFFPIALPESFLSWNINVATDKLLPTNSMEANLSISVSATCTNPSLTIWDIPFSSPILWIQPNPNERVPTRAFLSMGIFVPKQCICIPLSTWRINSSLPILSFFQSLPLASSYSHPWYFCLMMLPWLDDKKLYMIAPSLVEPLFIVCSPNMSHKNYMKKTKLLLRVALSRSSLPIAMEVMLAHP
jgi:hypothetical protein